MLPEHKPEFELLPELLLELLHELKLPPKLELPQRLERAPKPSLEPKPPPKLLPGGKTVREHSTRSPSRSPCSTDRLITREHCARRVNLDTQPADANKLRVVKQRHQYCHWLPKHCRMP